MQPVEDIARRHGIAGDFVLLAQQGRATFAYASERYVIKIAREACHDETYTEVLVAPLARAAGVRTPALVAWAREEDLAYSIWERARGTPVDDDEPHPEVWRDVGRLLAKLHGIDTAADPRGVLNKPDKRDARPYLHLLSPARQLFFAHWLEVCDRAHPASPRLAHYDVHGLNVLRDESGRATLIDWADAAWADPAAEFGSIFMRDIPEVLAGYEETASLGPDAEGRILRAVIGQAVRKLVTSDWPEPLDHLLAWARGNPAPRFRRWLPSLIPRV